MPAEPAGAEAAVRSLTTEPSGRSSSSRCRYDPAVKSHEWWPSSRRIASLGTPRRNMIEAHECRNVCNPTGHSIPARFPAARTTAYSFVRSSGPPVDVANTSVSHRPWRGAPKASARAPATTALGAGRSASLARRAPRVRVDGPRGGGVVRSRCLPSSTRALLRSVAPSERAAR